MDYKLTIIDYLSDELDLDRSFVEDVLEVPPREDMGDFALPCFRLAKAYRKAPQAIAQDLADKAKEKGLNDRMDRIEAQGPYLNIFLNKDRYTADLIRYVLEKQERFASSDEGNGKTVCIEFSSPNIAKPFHVGHAFTTFLGDALARMYGHLGYDLERINHLGDYGTQFGKLIVAYENWGDQEALDENPIKELLRIYVKFHQEVKDNPELEDQARARFKALEEGQPREYALWKDFRELSIREFDRIYDRLDVSFDSYRGESAYSDLIPPLVEELEEKGILVDSEGAKVVMLDDEGLPPCIVVKSDGSTIYATRDLAAAKYRYDTYKFYKNVYVVGLPQSLHFRQVFAVLKKAGYDWVDNCVHVGFGLVKFPEGALLSTRSGDVVYLEDLLDEAVKKTKDIILENNKTRDEVMTEQEIEETSQAIGLGAIRYTFLRNGREKDIIFRWEDILDFEGDSSPYMQYAYARAKSIIRKSGYTEEEIMAFEPVRLGEDASFVLAKSIAQLEESLKQAVKSYEPSIFARQVMTVCRNFSRFYNQMPILAAPDEEDKKARLSLCLASANVVKTSLNLLGIKTVERM